jgi:hypothetical protein
VSDPAAPAPPFRTIDDLAQLCGQYGWVETRLFEVTGQWAGDEGPPEWRHFSSVTSAHHAALATEWRARLPVRAGVDQEALLLPPPTSLGPMVATLDGHSLEVGFPILIGEVLPELSDQYLALLDTASAVREAPVMALLARAATGHADVTERGRRLLQRG